MTTMKITEEHVGKYVKGENWFYPVRVVFIDGDYFVYKNAYGMLFVEPCKGDWQVDHDDLWWTNK
jgi:hypothetical protein